MFETNIIVVGNVLTAPEWRRTTHTNSLVANFRVASTARRLDRESGRWIDGNSLRVRVSCWRRLAEGVASSIMVGDPIIVAGRLYTRDWTDTDGNPRTMYELEAVAVGHDLARGRGKFFRNRPTLGTSAVENMDADAYVRDETARSVPVAEAPTRYGDGMLDDEEPGFADVPPASPEGYDPLAVMRGGGFGAFDLGSTMAPAPEGLSPYAEDSVVHTDDTVPPSGEPLSAMTTELMSSREAESTAPSAGLDDENPAEPGAGAGQRRARRPGRGAPVPA